MDQTILAADGLVLTPAWILGTLGGAGTVIAFLFRLLMTSKDREIARISEDFNLYREQVKKDELRREKEDVRLDLLLDEAMKVKDQHGKSANH